MATYQQLIAPSNYYRLNVSITQVSQDIANNTSLVRVVGSITGMSSYATASYARSINSVNIDGVTYAPTTAYALANGKTVQIFSYERTVNHADDGKKTVSVSWTFTGGDTASSWNPNGTINCSEPLTQIGRASTAYLSSTSVNYGDTFSVVISRASTTFLHEVTVKSAQGNQIYYTGVGDGRQITIPTSWLASFTNGASTSGTVTVQTKNGSANIGSPITLGFTLNVPRGAASIVSNSTYYGGSISLNLVHANTTLTREITVKIYSRYSVYSTSSDTSQFTIPTEWMNSFTTGTKANGTVTVQTKNGSANIGSPITLGFTCDVPSGIKPNLTVYSPTITNGSLAYYGGIIGVSTVEYPAYAESMYGANIVTYRWSTEGLTGNQSRFTFTPTQATHTITCTATDTRGRTTSTSVTLTSLPYNKPTLSLDAYRCNSSGVRSNDGTYARFTPTFTYSMFGTANTVRLNSRINTSPQTNYENPNPTSGALSPTLGNNLINVNNSYVVTVTVTDTLGSSASSSYTLPVSEVLMNFPGTANAMAIGQYSTREQAFEIGWETYIQGSAIVERGVTNNITWIKLYNGVLIQYGRAYHTGGNTVNTRSVPIPFFSSEYFVDFAFHTTGAVNATITYVTASSSFNWYPVRASTGGTVPNNFSGIFIAIGVWK